MKRELILHLSVFFAFFVLATLLRQFFNLSYWSFWLGGIVGTFLPDIDHLIYVFFIQPQELTSQRINFLLNRQELKRIVTLLYETRGERKGLIFHTIFFQIIFLVLTFWILRSSDSLFGMGLVLAFSIHLLVDQIVDLMQLNSFDNWLKYSPIYLDLEKAKVYWLVIAILIFVFGIFL